MGDNSDDGPKRSPLRDDHEAALARADALQADLDAERAKGEVDKERLAKLETELTAARAVLDRAAGDLAKLKPADDVPSTRKQPAQPPAEPPARTSALSIENTPPQFPDDGQFSRIVRKVDFGVGWIIQLSLFVTLITVVLTAAAAAISDKVFGHHMGRWWFTVVRSGTFTIAMWGAVFATHQSRHLAMDLVSRRLTPRGRLILGLVLKLFTIAIAAVLMRSGLHQLDHVGGHGDEFISDKAIVRSLPAGAFMIIFFTFLHILIDVDYLVRGKLPPEKARSAH